MKYLFISLLFLSGMTCNQQPTTDKEENSNSMNAEQPVYEIAIRMVKEGLDEDFLSARSNFINQLRELEAALIDREFQSFYSLPAPDERPVFIGMTKWASASKAQEAAEALLPSAEAAAFFQTFDFKAYVMVVPEEGGAFNLATLAVDSGQVLELAVRRVKEGHQAQFDQSRKEFVEMLDSTEGVLGSWEFKVVGGQDTDGLTVGMSVYDSQEAFQRIAQELQNSPQAAAYFNTFEPVALQYAITAGQ